MATVINATSPAQKIKLSRFSILAFLLAVLLPPLGVILCIIALIYVSKQKLHGSFLSVVGIIVGTFLSVTVVPLFSLLWLWGAAPNKAEAYAKPVLRTIEASGGTKLCDNGDPGNGPDNTIPWYRAYYQINDSGSLSTILKDNGTSNGVNLQDDTATVNALKNANYGFVNNITPDNAEFYQPDAAYLISTTNGNIVRIEISRNTHVTFDCDTDQTAYSYGQDVTTPQGQAILTVDTGAFSLDS